MKAMRGKMKEHHAKRGKVGDNRFDRIDSDGSGALSLEEFRAMAKKMSERRGKADAQKGTDFAQKAFSRMDADGNGEVSREEMAAGVKHMQDRRGKKSPR